MENNNGNLVMEDEETRKGLAADSFKYKKLKKTLILTAIIVGIMLFELCIIFFQGKKIDKQNEKIDDLINTPILVESVPPVISLDVINAEIREIGELATTEYAYTNAAKFSDSKNIKWLPSSIVQKSFILKWDGVIKTGVDVTEVQTEVDTLRKVVTVSIPQAKILSHDIDEDSVEVLEHKNGLFNPVTIEDKVKFDAEMSQEMEIRAFEHGLLDKAQENAQTVITHLLHANPNIRDTYTIEFELLPQN